MKKLHFIIGIALILLIFSVQAAAAGLPPDGQYLIEATLSGGSGRAQVSSPTTLTVANGTATAVVLWSSPYYETMLVDGVVYHPINTGGNSMFEIPVMLESDMAVRARTVAMSRPHEIDYTLRFDSATIQPLSREKTALIPLGTAAIMAVLCLMTCGGLFVFAAGRKKKRVKSSRGEQGCKHEE